MSSRRRNKKRTRMAACIQGEMSFVLKDADDEQSLNEFHFIEIADAEMLAKTMKQKIHLQVTLGKLIETLDVIIKRCSDDLFKILDDYTVLLPKITTSKKKFAGSSNDDPNLNSIMFLNEKYKDLLAIKISFINESCGLLREELQLINFTKNEIEKCEYFNDDTYIKFSTNLQCIKNRVDLLNKYI